MPNIATCAASPRPPETSVLLVEDSVTDRIRLSCMLQKLGYKVAEAANGNEALATLRGTPCDIILSDWLMPELDGLGLCHRVKSDDRIDQPYFIMLTGRSATADLIAGMDAGADDFIAKPAGNEELRVRLQAGVRSLQLRRQAEQRSQALQSTLGREQSELTRVRQDLEAAARLQHSVLPDLGTMPSDLEAAFLYRPADAVGGDALGIHDLGNGLSSCFVLDCCGHGIAAAMQAIGLGRRLAPGSHSDSLAINASNGRPRCPTTVIAKLNAIQCAERPANEQFTAIYGVINRRSGAVRLCAAGHPRPLLLRADGRIEWLAAGGLPVGILADSTYSGFDLRLEPGDQLLLYSDGLFDRGGPGPDTEQLAEAYADNLRHRRPRHPQDVVDASLEWLGDTANPDDTTLLVLSR